MSDTSDLRDLLDKLRRETGPLPPEPGEEAGAPVPAVQPRRPANWARPAAAYRPYRQSEPVLPAEPPHVSFWSENKEILLFGMLASLVAALGGVLAGLEYLVVAGTGVFVMFSLVLCAALIRVLLVTTRRPAANQALEERIDALSKRVEALSLKAASQGAPAQGVPSAPDPGLERKVEELRIMIKNLSKAVEGGR